jgi:hypothetical protein
MRRIAAEVAEVKMAAELVVVEMAGELVVVEMAGELVVVEMAAELAVVQIAAPHLAKVAAQVEPTDVMVCSVPVRPQAGYPTPHRAASWRRGALENS